LVFVFPLVGWVTAGLRAETKLAEKRSMPAPRSIWWTKSF